MSNRARVLFLSLGLLFVGLAPTGCSKDKEQCNEVLTAVLSAHQEYSAAQEAAERGNRANFETARKKFEEQLKALEGIPVPDGDSLLAETTRSNKTRYPAAAKEAMVGWATLLEEVEKNPELGSKYAGGIPPIGKDHADSHSTASAVARSMSCPK